MEVDPLLFGCEYMTQGKRTLTQGSYQEAVMWKHLNHSKTVPLLRITAIPLQLISDWMSGGDLLDYIKKHPHAD